MFRWFENRLNPFPPEEPVEPPKTLVAFCLHYTRGAWPYIVVDAVLVAAIAIAEVWMFGFLGRIVDWLSVQNRETFLATEGWKLAGMAFIVAGRAARHGLVPFAAQPADADGQLPDAHPLAGAPLPAQAVDDLLPGRVRRPHRHQADADGARRARMRHQADRRA